MLTDSFKEKHDFSLIFLFKSQWLPVWGADYSDATIIWSIFCDMQQRITQPNQITQSKNSWKYLNMVWSNQVGKESYRKEQLKSRNLCIRLMTKKGTCNLVTPIQFKNPDTLKMVIKTHGKNCVVKISLFCNSLSNES